MQYFGTRCPMDGNDAKSTWTPCERCTSPVSVPGHNPSYPPPVTPLNTPLTNCYAPVTGPSGYTSTAFGCFPTTNS